MAVSQPTLSPVPSLGARVVVTLGALAAYRLGAYLPLPGIDQMAWVTLGQSGGLAAAFERISVVSLGVTPLVSALLLVEVARLLSRRFNSWADSSTNNMRRLDRYAFIGAALLAAVQAYGIADALEAAGTLVAEPGLSFRITTVATLVAGAAALMWLAVVISRHGLGSGVWLLLLAPHLAGLPQLAIAVLETLRTGAMAVAVPVALLAYAIGAVAVLSALGLTLKRLGRPLDRTLIWPLFIAFLPAGALSIAPWLLPASPIRDALAALLSPGAPVYLAAVAAFVVAVSLAQWRRAEPQGATASPPPVEDAGTSPVLLTALALAAIAVVPWFLTSRLNVPFLIDGRWLVVLVAVALPVVGVLRR